MRTFLAMIVPAVVLSSALLACGSSSSDPTAEGEMLVASNACGSCHTGAKGLLAGGDTPQGGVYGPNLTPDMATGLGGWTDDQIKAAIKSGTDDEGATLCASMARYSSLTDEQLTAMVAYLRSIPAISNEVMAGSCTVP